MSQPLHHVELKLKEKAEHSGDPYVITVEHGVVDTAPTMLDASLKDKGILQTWEVTNKDGTRGSQWFIGKISHIYNIAL